MGLLSTKFVYEHVTINGHSFILITDTKEGTAVTHSIAEVIKNICVSKFLKAEEHIWLYRDQSDIWDGYDVSDNGFVMIGANTSTDAINVFLARKDRKRSIAGPNYIQS